MAGALAAVQPAGAEGDRVLERFEVGGHRHALKSAPRIALDALDEVVAALDSPPGPALLPAGGTELNALAGVPPQHCSDRSELVAGQRAVHQPPVNPAGQGSAGDDDDHGCDQRVQARRGATPTTTPVDVQTSRKHA